MECRVVHECQRDQSAPCKERIHDRTPPHTHLNSWAELGGGVMSEVEQAGIMTSKTESHRKWKHCPWGGQGGLLRPSDWNWIKL